MVLSSNFLLFGEWWCSAWSYVVESLCFWGHFTTAPRHHWPQKPKIRTEDHALHHHWPPKVKDSNPRPCTTALLTPKKSQRFEQKTMHYTTIDPKKPKIRTEDHALHHHWPQEAKDSNRRPCTTPPLTPKSQRFEQKTMHYTTIDPKKSKIRTEDHALHNHWPRKVKDSNPRPLWGYRWRHPQAIE
jgi:hypothetical protein